jgi:dihydrofolate reductase
MRKIISTTFVSLDGVMQAPGKSDEDPSGGFEFGGWIAPYVDDAVTKILAGIYVLPYDLLLGRRTYDIFAGFWPNVTKDPRKPGYDPDNAKISEQFDAVTKYVATHSPETCTWQRTKWLGKNTVSTVSDLKKQDGPPLLLVGSGNLFKSLMDAGLVDEIQLLVFPVVLGRGKRLFADKGRAAGFKPTASTITPSGVFAATYTASGNVKTGSADKAAKTHQAPLVEARDELPTRLIEALAPVIGHR